MRRKQRNLLVMEEPEEQFEAIPNPFRNRWMKVATIAAGAMALTARVGTGVALAGPPPALRLVKDIRSRRVLKMNLYSAR